MNILVLILVVFNINFVIAYKLSENDDPKNVINGEDIRQSSNDKTSLRSSEGDSRDTRWR